MKYYESASRIPPRLDRVEAFGEQRAKNTQVRLMALGAVMAMALLSGCASPQLKSDSDPLQYNSETGYPAVGGPHWVSL